MTPVAYGYCRASTGKQDLTFDVQRRSIEKYFASKLAPEGYRWGGFYEDKATSGGKPFTERDKGRELWVIAQPGDAIVWHKMDRAFRSVRDGANTLHLLKQKNISVHSIDISLDTSSALGDFVCHLLMLLGELERSWVSSRTREAIAERRRTGRPTNGSAPAGYKVCGEKKNRHYRVDATERSLLQSVYDQFAGGRTLESISNELWRKKTVRYNGHQYELSWLIYAMHARAMGYPVQYTMMEYRAYIRRLKDQGDSVRGRKAMIGRLQELVTVAHQSHPAACQADSSDVSSQSEDHSLQIAQTH